MSKQIQPLIDQARIDEAAAILKAGGLVAFPTETVYGLGADAKNEAALAKLYAVKGRPTKHPVIVHLDSIDQLPPWAVDIPPQAYQLAHVFWPGPLTLILKRAPGVLDAITGGQETVGLRVPNHPVALALLRAFGGGVAAPSANRFGRLSPTQASHVAQDLGSDVDCILDGGACTVGVESTIVAFHAGQPIILRPGMITQAQIEAALHVPFSQNDLTAQTSTVSRAPGTLASHYAPHTPVLLKTYSAIAQEWMNPKSAQMGVLSVHSCPQGFNENWIAMPADPEAYAKVLYARLRELDQRGLSQIWVEAVPEDGPWAAVSDRLKRAAYRA